jgi:PAS domain S-box-containing protein
MDHLHALLSPQFLPQGEGYLWNHYLIWLHAFSDSAIAVAFFAIPVELAYFARNRRDLPFVWIFWMFVVFIFGCGAIHLFEVLTIWHPVYWVEGAIKAVTAVASLATVVALMTLIPGALALEGEEKFRALFQSAPDAMILLGADGKISLINAQTEKLFGYGGDELTGHSIEVLVPRRFREHHPGLREEYFSAPRPRPMGAGRNLLALRRDGTEFAAEISLSPIQTVAGTLVAAAIRDISARKQFEEENLRRVHEASRLKSEFVANMSHELRTPLNTVIGFASFIQSGKAGPVSDAQQEFLGDILTSGRHLLQLISDILDVAKIEAGKMKFNLEPVALQPLVEEVHDAMRVLAAEKHITLSSEVDPSIGIATLDRAKLTQVLYNYLSNAIKFTPEDGRIEVRVVPDRGDTFRIEVEDSGIGIDAKDLPRLFADFHQLDAGSAKKYQGAGLGLSLTRRIVEAQGGMVGVRSTPKVGSTFWAILPRSMADEPRPSVSRLEDAAAPEVLVIETDPRQRAWLAEILREAEYDVQSVATGTGAVSLCQQRAFNAITLDLLLPDVSGLEILKRIRATELNRTVPVVAVTVSADRRANATYAIQDLLVNPDDDMVHTALRRAAITAGAAVLIVDDDPESLAMKEATLARLGYHPICRRSREEALAAVENIVPPAIVLNLFMPAMHGVELLNDLRKVLATRRVPVIAWSGRELSEDERQGLLMASRKLALRSQGDVEEMLEELRPYLAHSARGRDSGSHAA